MKGVQTMYIPSSSLGICGCGNRLSVSTAGPKPGIEIFLFGDLLLDLGGFLVRCCQCSKWRGGLLLLLPEKRSFLACRFVSTSIQRDALHIFTELDHSRAELRIFR